MSFTLYKQGEDVVLGTVSEVIIAVCAIIFIYYTFLCEGFEGWGNPQAARLVQCASDGLPGTEAGANCWGQIGPQGCPPDLPRCEDPNEDFMGGRFAEPPVFYSVGDERAVAKATRASSKNNNLNKQQAKEGFSSIDEEDEMSSQLNQGFTNPESFINY